MIGVQVCAHHKVDVLRPYACQVKLSQESAAALVVPGAGSDAARPRLVVSNACVDEDRVMRRANKERLDNESQVSQPVVQHLRPEPAAEGLPVLGRGLREKCQRIKVRLIGLNYPGDGEVADCAVG